MNMCTYLVLSHPPICCFTGSRGGGAGKGAVFSRANKKARTVENEIEEEFEQEAEIMPRQTTARTRGGGSKSSRNPKHRKQLRKPFHLWKPDDYQKLREENPYASERSLTAPPQFYTKDQESIYNEICVQGLQCHHSALSKH